MKTITLTDESTALLIKICAAGGMAIQENAQHVEKELLNMLLAKRTGHYPEREQKEIIIQNLEIAERATKTAINAFKLIKELDLIDDDDDQKKAVDEIIENHENFLTEELAQAKIEFEEVVNLMNNPDYNPNDYRKPNNDL